MVLLQLYSSQPAKLQKLERTCAAYGYFSKSCSDLAAIEKLFSRTETHIIIFDADQEAGKISTLLTKQLKRSHAHGIIILSSDGDLARRLNWFDLGADAVVDKQDMETILPARCLALYRRITNNFNFLTARADRTPLLQIIDNTHVFIKGKLIRLSPVEQIIVKYLIATAHRIVSRKELLEVLPLQQQKSRSLFNVHMHNLRQKFAQAGISAIITTKAGAGYQFNYQL